MLSRISRLHLLLLIFAICSSAHAAPRNVTHIQGLDALHRTLLNSPPPDTTLRVSAKIKGFGRVRIALRSSPSPDRNAQFDDGTRTTPDTSSLNLLRGTLTRLSSGARNRIKIAGSVSLTTHRSRAVLLFHGINLRSGAHRYFRLEEKRSRKSAQRTLILRAVPEDTLFGRSCSTTSAHALSDHNTSGGPAPSRYQVAAATVTLRRIELISVADFEWFSVYGDDSNNEIATVVNAANVFYERDLGATVDIESQFTRTTSTQPFTSTDAETLLNQLGDHVLDTNLNSDHVHLFSAKELDGSTIGIAWVGAVCLSTYHSTGVTQDFAGSGGTLSHVTFAHELGHNLDAEHDTSLPASIMFPSVSEEQTQFSSTSITQISNHIAVSGSCLDTVQEETGTPTPTPTATPTPSGTPGTPVPTATPTPEATPPSGGPSPPGTPVPNIYFLNVTKQQRLGSTRVMVGIVDTLGSSVASLPVHLNKVARDGVTETTLKNAVTTSIGRVNFRVKKSGKYRIIIDNPDGSQSASSIIKVRVRRAFSS